MKKCPTCNAEFGDGATYCDKCGTKLIKYRICPHCGAEASDDSIYCSKCGKAIDAVEEVSSVFEQTPASNRADSATIEQYKRELAIYRSKKTGMLITGSVLLGLGVTLFIVFMTLLLKTADTAPAGEFGGTYVLYLFLMVIFELMADAGIALLIVQGAVFGRKIANRERAIQEYESRQ